MKTIPFWQDDYPRPDTIPVSPLPEQVDVAVVGGGCTGLAAAYTLAKSGVATAVLEQDRIGAGASTRHPGMVTPGFRQSLANLFDLHGEALAMLPSLEWVGYLSTTGVYGDHNGAWVDEASETKPTAARSKRRVAAEQAWLAWGAAAGKPVQIFRLAGIYGPGRSPIDRVRGGNAQRIIKPGHLFGRIHVDDIVQIVRAGMAKPDAGPVFNVADDEPAAPADVLTFAAELLGMEPPPEVLFEEADMSPMARSFYADNRLVANGLMKRELGVTLRYPTYREGLRALL